MSPSRAKDDRDEQYDRLVDWLEQKHAGFKTLLACRTVPGAGRSLHLARDVLPEESILTIPSTALLNPLTLLNECTIPSHLFPLRTTPAPIASDKPRIKRRRTASHVTDSPRLNTTQLLTLHLALSRDPKARHPSKWEIYLDTLPESFRPWHPLSWLVKPEKDDERQWRWWNDLSRLCTPGAERKLEEVKARWEEDRAVLVVVLSQEEPFKSQGVVEDIAQDVLLWAWLNVNTRSVSLPLGIPGPIASSLQNHTLVPFLDLINHSSSPDVQLPNPRQVPSRHPAPRRGGSWLTPGHIDFELRARKNGGVEGEAATFEYGAFGAETLWAEWGFIERPTLSTAGKPSSRNWREMRYGSTDIRDMVLSRWEDPFVVGRREKEDVLRAIGCWDDWTLYTQPKPAPSYALLMSLRILHLPAASSKLIPIREGLVTFVSTENERAALGTLRQICDDVSTQCETSTRTLGGLSSETRGGNVTGLEESGMRKRALEDITLMWAEREWLVHEIAAAIDRGETFD